MIQVKVTKILVLAMCLSLLPAINGFGQSQEEGGVIGTQKLAQTGFKFLTISLDARAAGMADAMTAHNTASTSLFYNPAGMARMDKTFSVGLGMVQWIADIDYNAISAAVKSPIGVIGVSGLLVRYGEFLETIRADNEAGYIDLGTYQPSAHAFGLGYARSLTNRFSVGAGVKMAYQNLGEAAIELDENGDPISRKYGKQVVAYDFGVIYETGFKSLNLAMNVRNFSQEVTFVEENLELPLTFRIGMSMNLVDLTAFNPNTHSLILAIDTQRPRDYYEQIKIGAEYQFMKRFAIRAGYIAPHDELGLSAGFGLINIAGLDLDYAYSSFGAFGTVNRLSLSFGL